MEEFICPFGEMLCGIAFSAISADFVGNVFSHLIGYERRLKKCAGSVNSWEMCGENFEAGEFKALRLLQKMSGD
jgi:hypothetical protein